MPFGIVLVDCKSPGVAVFAVVKDDLFPDVGGADQSLSCRIPTQRKVIQFVGRSSGLLPYSHTEGAGYRGTPRIHYFRSVAMPRGIPLINRRAVGDTYTCIAAWVGHCGDLHRGIRIGRADLSKMERIRNSPMNKAVLDRVTSKGEYLARTGNLRGSHEITSTASIYVSRAYRAYAGRVCGVLP